MKNVGISEKDTVQTLYVTSKKSEMTTVSPLHVLVKNNQEEKKTHDFFYDYESVRATFPKPNSRREKNLPKHVLLFRYY